MIFRRRSIEEWASETDFDTPLKWGEIEREVLRRRYPPQPDEKLGLKIFDIAMLFGLPIVLAIMFGASVVALILVAIGLHAADPGSGAQFIGGARVPLAFTVFASAVTLIDVGDDSWRQRWEVVMVAFHGVVAAVTYALLAPGSNVDGASVTRWYALAAAVVSFAAMLVQIYVSLRAWRRRRRPGSREQGPRKQKARVPMTFYGQQRCRAARERVMEVLDRRGLTRGLQESRKQKMLRMPLGSWADL